MNVNSILWENSISRQHPWKDTVHTQQTWGLQDGDKKYLNSKESKWMTARQGYMNDFFLMLVLLRRTSFDHLLWSIFQFNVGLLQHESWHPDTPMSIFILSYLLTTIICDIVMHHFPPYGLVTVRIIPLSPSCIIVILIVIIIVIITGNGWIRTQGCSVGGE